MESEEKVPRLESIYIDRFKRLRNVELSLADCTVLVGANNCGKSSVLQAMHFAVAVAQSSAFVQTARWSGEELSTSLSAQEIIWSPTADPYSLATDMQLQQGQPIIVTFKFDDGNETSVRLAKGRNRNLLVKISGRQHGIQLRRTDNPFTVYVPGVAGISKAENLLSQGQIRRAVARGDANLVFRNVLYLLKHTRPKWQAFLEDLQEVFGEVNIVVNFDTEHGEHIAVFAQSGNRKIPIDAAGTGLLQAIHILAYLHYFAPQVLLLDEPDSHLHADNQTNLCQLLEHISQNRDVQVILTTHSSHILDYFTESANLVWIREGTVMQPADTSRYAMLADLGAFGLLDRIRNGDQKCVVLTEDVKTKPLKAVLEANGFVMGETAVYPYQGVGNLAATLALKSFLRDHCPQLRLVIHRDRDYMPAEETQAIIENLADDNCNVFLTQGSDIEDAFCNVDHITALAPEVDLERSRRLLQQAMATTIDDSIIARINLRTPIEERRARDRQRQFNHGEFAIQARRDYENNPSVWRRGKIVVGRLTALLQQELGRNISLATASASLSTPELLGISASIWPER